MSEPKNQEPKTALDSFLNKFARLIARELVYFIPHRFRRSYIKFIVSKVLYKNTFQYLKRNDGKWICVSKNSSGIDYLFTGDINHKRFNRDNYYPLLTQVIEKGDTVIDIGASYGDEVIDLADLVGEQGIVYAFEPDPEDFIALQKTIKINNLQNVKCLNLAVGDKQGKLNLRQCRGNRTTNLSDSRNIEGLIEVDSITLDIFWKDELNRRKIDFIKIDTDGAELDIIDGAKQLIESNPNCLILSEYLPKIGYRGLFGTDTLKWYEENGFNIHKIQQSYSKITQVDFERFTQQMNEPKFMICHDVLLTSKNNNTKLD